MFKKRAALLVTMALAGALATGLIAAPAQAALRHVDGTVVSKNGDNRTFKIRTQNGNRLRIKVDGTTEFERIAGFGALRKGMQVEVDYLRTDNGLLAKQVEPQGGGGGDDNGGGGADDGPNHT
ncbi:MAG TPA: DUF5666 domain-containing protein [Solirubrobacterales bacterium]|nr:DUF5666 domain-containing protein [Solirubrobacterales bacterium]